MAHGDGDAFSFDFRSASADEALLASPDAHEDD
jgi:hypothetical protein